MIKTKIVSYLFKSDEEISKEVEEILNNPKIDWFNWELIDNGRLLFVYRIKEESEEILN